MRVGWIISSSANPLSIAIVVFLVFSSLSWAQERDSRSILGRGVEVMPMDQMTNSGHATPPVRPVEPIEAAPIPVEKPIIRAEQLPRRGQEKRERAEMHRREQEQRGQVEMHRREQEQRERAEMGKWKLEGQQRREQLQTEIPIPQEGKGIRQTEPGR